MVVFTKVVLEKKQVHWNRVPVNKIFIEQNTPEPKVKAYIPMYQPLQISKCEKCRKVIAEPKELIRILKEAVKLNEEEMIVMDKLVFKLDKIPEGSRLEEYVKKLPKIMNGSKAEILSFLNNTFVECLEFLKQNTDIVYLPTITLKLIPAHEQFKREEQRESKKAISKEVAKAPVHAFVVGNRFQKRLYIDLEFFIDLLKFGYLSFIINLVHTYIHEILHIGFPQKYEQEIHDLECSLVEAFLGIELPKEIKNLKASDYYSQKNL